MNAGQGNGLPMTTSALYNRYRNESVATMSPARLVLALYDRLVLDLDRAGDALAINDVGSAHAALVHAQDIVEALHDSLDVSMWSAGAQLAELYVYLHGELVAANVDKDRQRVLACRELVVPLRDTWHEAAGVPGTTPDRVA